MLKFDEILQKFGIKSEKIKEIAKNFVNKIRIPSLLSFFISKEGQIDPSIKDTLATASPASQNWVRLGLEKTWKYFAVLALVLLIYWGKGALQFIIEVASQGSVVLLLGFIGFAIWKSVKK
jgi:hypothetical protein